MQDSKVVEERPLERTLSIDMPLAEYKASVVSRLKEIAKTARVKGFRPGKTPLKIIEQQHGGHVRQELLDAAIRKSFADTVKGKNLRVAAPPSVELKSAADGETLSFNATFEVYPEVSVPDLADVEIKKYKANLGDGDIDEMIEKVRNQRVSFNTVIRPSIEGDQIEVDYKGTINEVEFEGGSAQGASFVIGEGRLLPQFEDNLTALQAGDSKKFSLVFPDDYQSNDLAGKEATFVVDVKEVREPLVPSVDESFIKSLGVESGKPEDLREMFHKNMELDAENRANFRTKDEMFKRMVDIIPVDLPDALVKQEVHQLEHKMKHDMESRGVSEDKINLPAEVFEDEAKSRVRLGIIISEIARQRDVKITPEKLRNRVDEFAANYKDPDEVVNWHYENPARLERFESMIIEEGVMELILKEAKVTEELVDFSELTGDNL